MKIDIQTIPHRFQRYESSGDWQIAHDGTITIRVSQLSNPDYEFCEALHEMIEAWLCQRAGVTQQMVDDFDFAYEAAHQRGDTHYPCGCPHQRLSDPGSDPHSPYLRAHFIAEAAEAVVARALRVDWRAYDEEAERPPDIEREVQRRTCSQYASLLRDRDVDCANCGFPKYFHEHR